jgi:uncharacterized membrane protein
LVCVIALLVLHLVWQIALSPASPGARTIGAVAFGVPLAAVLVAWRWTPRKAAVYGAALGLFCFAHGVLLLMSKPAYPVPGALEIGLVLVLNAALYLGMRGERRAARAAQTDRSHSRHTA